METKSGKVPQVSARKKYLKPRLIGETVMVLAKWRPR